MTWLFTQINFVIRLNSGFIGKIRLQIPVRHLKTEPWVISIENLYLVAGPASRSKYDESEDKQQQERKQQQLDAIEAQWKVCNFLGQAFSTTVY